MNKEKRRVPKLRFPGFTEDWEQRKFGEIYERAGQKNDLTYGIDKIISVANMYFKKDVIVGSEEYLKTYNVFKLGDIAFEGHTNKEYRYGRFVENTIGDGIVSHIFDVFTPKINLDINFWKDLIKYEPIMGPILRRCTKASRMMSNLTTKEFLEEQILCPTLEEQKLIGEFIVSLDKNITLHQRKLEHLNLKKKALLQKLFPKNGERYPELRFPGFTDAWEQRKFDEIMTFINGRAYKQDELLSDGKYKVLRVGNFYTNDSWYYSNLELDDKYYAMNGDLLYTWSATFGPHIWKGEKVIYHYHIWKIVLKNKIDKLFALQLLEVDKANIMSDKNGSTMVHITKQGMENKKTILPLSLNEQKQISKFLSSIDKLITLHQRKLEHLQLQKKALLQQMFV